MENGCRGVLDSARGEFQSIVNAVVFGDSWLSVVCMQKLNCVGEQEGLGDAVDNMETAVVIQIGSDVEALAAAEVPGFLDAWIVVNDHWAVDGY